MKKITINPEEENEEQGNSSTEPAAEPSGNNGTAAGGAESDRNISENSAKADAAGSKAEYNNDDLIKKNREYLDHLQRLQAEFENYKKRTKKEKSDTIRFASSQLAERLLPVVDNLQRGLKCSADTAAAQEILTGIRMVERQLLDLLAENGVTPFETLGASFDPNVHQPVYTVERDDMDENLVVEEIEKGYMIHDKLLRPAKVVVSRTPAQS